MTRNSDVEILRNLFEEAIEQTSKIYKKLRLFVYRLKKNTPRAKFKN